MKEYYTKNKTERAIFTTLYREYTNELSQYSQRIKENPTTEEDIKDINSNALLKRYFITNETNNPIGFCLLGFGENTQPGTDWYIAEFFIKEEYQHKGYGEKAFSELLQTHPGKYCYFVLKKEPKSKNLLGQNENKKQMQRHNCTIRCNGIHPGGLLFLCI